MFGLQMERDKERAAEGRERAREAMRNPLATEIDWDAVIVRTKVVGRDVRRREAVSWENWKHPYGGVYRRRVDNGLYEVERSMDDRRWRAWWMPDDDPQQRTGLTAVARRTAQEAQADALDHLWESEREKREEAKDPEGGAQ